MNLGNLQRVLMVAPHPDDEIIGCGGLIARLKAKDCAVRVLIVTNGVASHRSSASYPSSKLEKLRKKESRRALSIIKVNAADIVFAGFPDGGAKQWGMCAVPMRKLRRALAGHWDAVIGPSSFDAHPDHRSARTLIRKLRPDCRYFAYTVWPAEGRAKSSGTTVPLGTQRMRKRVALKSYRSQLGLIKDDPSGFSLSPSDVRRFDNGYERFFTA